MSLSIVILAAGAGTRMKSALPKVLMPLAGKPLLEHVLDAVNPMNAKQILGIYGHKGEQVKKAMQNHPIKWIEQKEQLGTGHAVLQALPNIDNNHQVLILCGDVPLISTETLENLVESTGNDQVGLLTAIIDDPAGLGRIIRDDYQQVASIIEEKDTSELQRQIKEINAGVYCVPAKLLKKWLPKLSNTNAQHEYYLTDIIKLARQEHIGINVARPKKTAEIYGANTRIQLAALERIYQQWEAEKLMLAGVSMIDPARVDIRGTVTPAQDAIIDVNTTFEGDVVLSKNCHIGPNCIIKNSKIGPNVIIAPNSIIEDSVIEANAVIGPFARVRPGTVIKEHAKIGNFVEVKKSTIGRHSKANHLSYIGDATVGEHANIGAGVITCNYDGAHKHQTVIEDDVFIGSDVQLVAPVTIKTGATIGAGTTVTKNVEAGTLAISRIPQKSIDGWTRPKKR